MSFPSTRLPLGYSGVIGPLYPSTIKRNKFLDERMAKTKTTMIVMRLNQQCAH
jgi:hypothetical protein